MPFGRVGQPPMETAHRSSHAIDVRASSEYTIGMHPATPLQNGSIELSPVERERLGRLHVEVELAASRLELARERLKHVATQAANSHGITGSFEIDFASGINSPRIKSWLSLS